MVKSVTISKQEFESKLVQEIAKSGDNVPQKYLLKDGLSEAIDDPSMWRDNMLIDLSILNSSTPLAELELAKLRSALCNWGCFMVVNHEMEKSFLEELIEVAKEFFELPLEEKEKSAGLSNDIFQGYGNDTAYINLPVTSNWNDRLFLTIYPEDKRELQFWPQKPEKLRGILEEFTKKITMLNKTLYKEMARCMELEEDCILNRQGKEMIVGKLSMYPRCSLPKQVQGHLSHTDGTAMSIILPDNQVPGLEVFKDDQWYKVPLILGALFINIGDMGEAMSNGVFKSAIHRVTTNSSKDRVSVVAFCHPEDTDEIGPMKEFVTADEPQKFRSFSINEFTESYFRAYGLDESSLDAFKL